MRKHDLNFSVEGERYTITFDPDDYDPKEIERRGAEWFSSFYADHITRCISAERRGLSQRERRNVYSAVRERVIPHFKRIESLYKGVIENAYKAIRIAKPVRKRKYWGNVVFFDGERLKEALLKKYPSIRAFVIRSKTCDLKTAQSYLKSGIGRRGIVERACAACGITYEEIKREARRD